MSTMQVGNFVSVNDAARSLGLTVGRIRQLLIAGELAGQKINEKAWIIAEAEVKRFAKTHKKRKAS